MLKIDYLTFNISKKDADEIGFPIAGNHEQISSIKNYSFTTKSKLGYLCSHGNNMSDTYHVNVGGKVIDTMMHMKSNAGMYYQELHDEREILDLAISRTKNFTRMDIALDIDHAEEKGFLVSDIHAMLAMGALQAYSSEVSMISSLDGRKSIPETIYIGAWEKRAKRGIIRIYDKSLEISGVRGQRTRIEVELKRDKADINMRRHLSGANTLADIFIAQFTKIPDELRLELRNTSPLRRMGKEEVDSEGVSRSTWIVSMLDSVLANMNEGDNLFSYTLKECANVLSKHMERVK